MPSGQRNVADWPSLALRIGRNTIWNSQQNTSSSPSKPNAKCQGVSSDWDQRPRRPCRLHRVPNWVFLQKPQGLAPSGELGCVRHSVRVQSLSWPPSLSAGRAGRPALAPGARLQRRHLGWSTCSGSKVPVLRSRSTGTAHPHARSMILLQVEASLFSFSAAVGDPALF